MTRRRLIEQTLRAVACIGVTIGLLVMLSELFDTIDTYYAERYDVIVTKSGTIMNVEGQPQHDFHPGDVYVVLYQFNTDHLCRQASTVINRLTRVHDGAVYIYPVETVYDPDDVVWMEMFQIPRWLPSGTYRHERTVLHSCDGHHWAEHYPAVTVDVTSR